MSGLGAGHVRLDFMESGQKLISLFFGDFWFVDRFRRFALH
jgi:hypothetical protein